MRHASEPNSFGQTPLTDPRSLLTTSLVHLALVFVASLLVVSVARTPESSGSKALYAELDPLQAERAEIKPHPGSGGGGPGELGGTSRLPRLDDEALPRGETRDPMAETLLDEILPEPTPSKPTSSTLSLPGPSSLGQGLIPGSGAGGGGGAGGGSAAGAGPGIGPGTQFFGAKDHAHSFAYVIDCSGSMRSRNSLEVAKRELLASVGQLPPDASFAVIFYNLHPTVISDPRGNPGLMPATRSNKGWVESRLAAVKAEGGTDHLRALDRALTFKPEVIFFLTDADMMSSSDVNQILSRAGTTRIQTIEFGQGINLGEKTPLSRLASSTGGTYSYIDVSKFPRTDGF